MGKPESKLTDHHIPTTSDLAVVGAGPIGLEAAAWAVSHHWDVALFEEAGVGHNIRQWGYVKLFSPFSMNHSQWGPRLIAKAFPDFNLPSESTYMTGMDYVDHYLDPLSQVPEISERLYLDARVLHISKDRMAKRNWIGDVKRLQSPFRILLRQGDRDLIHKTSAVIDATGIYSSPQFLGSGNIPAPGELEAQRQAPTHLRYGLVDVLGKHREQFAGGRTLLVGGGHSAATVLEAFEQLAQAAPETHLFWVNLSPKEEPYKFFENDPLPYREQLIKLGNRLASAPPSWLHYCGSSSVEEISRWPGGNEKTFEVVVDSPGGLQRFQVDEIIVNTGFIPDNSIYRQLQVHECYASAGPIKLAAELLGGSADCLAQKSQGIETLKNPEPNFFILGNKSYGTNSTFLITHGIEQVETVMTYLEETISDPSILRLAVFSKATSYQ